MTAESNHFFAAEVTARPRSRLLAFFSAVVYITGAAFSASVSILTGLDAWIRRRRARVRLRGKCIARKYSATFFLSFSFSLSLSLFRLPSAHPFISTSPPFFLPSICVYDIKTSTFPAAVADSTWTVVVDASAPQQCQYFAVLARAFSLRALYSGGNCAEFQPLKCVEGRGESTAQQRERGREREQECT